MKKFLTYGVVIATIVWSLGIGAIVPMAASAAYSPAAGDIIKVSGQPAVYYINAGLQRQLFSNRVTYGSWFNDFSGLKTISQADFNTINSSANVTVRPGTNLVKFDNSGAVYAVTPGAVLMPLASGDAAKALYGADWAKKIVIVQSSFEANYTKGAALTTTSKLPDGSVIKYAGSDSVYYITGGAKRLVTSDGFVANKLSDKFVITNVPTTMAFTDGSSVTAKEDAIAGISGNANVTPAVGNVTVTLSADTPISNTIVAGQAIADLGHFTFTGNGTITTLKIKRIGISQDTTLNNVYLYDGNTKLTDAGTVSNGYVTFSSPSGIFAVSGSKNIAVKADILASSDAVGQTVGVAINSGSDIIGTSIGGSFPIVANIMSVAGATNLATASFGASVTGSGSGINAGTLNTTIWSDSVSVTNKAVSLKYLKLKQIGSISSSDLQNFKLYADGIQVSSGGLDSNNNLVFDLSLTPATLNTGSRTIEVRADIVSGASKTYSFSLQQASDAVLIDTNYGVAISPVVSPSTTTFSALSAGTTTINGASTGALTVTTDPSYTATQVVKNSPNVTLGKWVVKAYGEDAKVMQLQAVVAAGYAAGATSTPSAEYVNNVAIYVDGVQVGSSQNLTLPTAPYASTGTTAIATVGTKTYGSGNLFTVAAGQTRTVEIRGDLQLMDSTRANSVKASLAVPASQVQGVSSFQTWPGTIQTYAPANTLSIVSGQLSAGVNPSFGSQTAAPNTAGQKIASYAVQASNAEGVNISNATLVINTTGSISANNLSNLYVQYGTTKVTYNGVPGASNNFSLSLTIPANTTQIVDVYADLPNATGAVSTTLALTGRTVNSQTSANLSATAGQTITVGAGTLTLPSAKSNLSLGDGYVVGGSTQANYVVYPFKASGAPVTIDELHFTVGGASNAISSVTVNGVTQSVFSGAVTLTGLNVVVPSDGSTLNLKVGAAMNSVTSGTATSNSTSSLSISYIKYHSGSTITENASPSIGASSVVYLTRTIPTVNEIAVPTTAKLQNGSLTLTKLGSVKITADQGGDLTVETIRLNVGTTGNAAVSTSTSGQVVIKDGGSTVSTSYTAFAATTGGVTDVTFTGGYLIAAGTSKTFDVYVKVTASGNSGTSAVTLSLDDPYYFSWADTDATAIAHSAASAGGQSLLPNNYNADSISSSLSN